MTEPRLVRVRLLDRARAALPSGMRQEDHRGVAFYASEQTDSTGRRVLVFPWPWRRTEDNSRGWHLGAANRNTGAALVPPATHDRAGWWVEQAHVELAPDLPLHPAYDAVAYEAGPVATAPVEAERVPGVLGTARVDGRETTGMWSHNALGELYFAQVNIRGIHRRITIRGREISDWRPFPTADEVLAEYKDRVRTEAKRQAKIHGWCNVVDDVLCSLDIDPNPTRTFRVTGYVEVQAHGEAAALAQAGSDTFTPTSASPLVTTPIPPIEPF